MIAAGMGRGWGQILRGWGGDGDMGRGDSEGTGREFSLRGGDGEEMLSPCHSLIVMSVVVMEIIYLSKQQWQVSDIQHVVQPCRECHIVMHCKLSFFDVSE